MMKTSHAVVAGLTLVAFGVIVEAAVVVPTSWRRLADEPRVQSPERVCAGQMSMTWEVTLPSDVVTVLARRPDYAKDDTPYDIDYAHAVDTPLPLPGDTRTLADRLRQADAFARSGARRLVRAVDDGWLIGFDGGEFGGSLWWYPKQARSGKKLADDNVRAIVLGDGRSGLAFVRRAGMTEGAVLSLGIGDTGWQIVSDAKLPGAPEVVLPQPTGAIVVTTASVDRVTWDGTVSTLSRVNYLGLYPSSLAVASDGEVVVGMRFFVGILRRLNDGYVHDWYVPAECARFRTRRYQCECVAPTKGG